MDLVDRFGRVRFPPTIFATSHPATGNGKRFRQLCWALLPKELPSQDLNRRQASLSQSPRQSTVALALQSGLPVGNDFYVNARKVDSPWQ